MKSANLYSWPEFFLKNPSSYWVFFLFAIVACLPIVAPIDSRLLGGDFGWPIHFQTFLNATLSTWDDSVGFGYPAPRQHASLFPFTLAAAFLENIGISSLIFQRFYIFSTIFVGLSGIYGIGKLYGFPRLQAVFASLCYATSGFALVYLTPNFGAQISMYYFLPVAIWLSIKYIQTARIIYPLCFLLLISPAFTNPVLFIVYVGLISLFGPVAVAVQATTIQIKQRFLVERSVVILLVLILSSFFWLGPFISDLRNVFASASNAGAIVATDIEIAKHDSLSLMHALLGMAEGFWPVAGGQGVLPNDFGYYFDWHDFALSPLNIIVHGLMLATIFLFLPKQTEQRKTFIFLLLLFVIAISVLAGLRLSSPFRWPMEALISFDFSARALRAWFNKFGIFLALPWALLMSYGLVGIAGVRTRLFPSLGLLTALAALFVVGYPYYTIQTYKEHEANLQGHWVKIPAEYFELQPFSAALPQTESLLVLPMAKSYNVSLSWEERGGYLGADFIKNVWNGPVVYSKDGSNEQNTLQECFSSSINHRTINKCIVDIRKFGIGFVLIRKDNKRTIGDSRPIIYSSFFKELSGVELVKAGKYFDLFKISDTDIADFVIETSCLQRAVKPLIRDTSARIQSVNEYGSAKKYGVTLIKNERSLYNFEVLENGSCSRLAIRKRAVSAASKWAMCIPSDLMSKENLTKLGNRVTPIAEKAIEILSHQDKSLSCFYPSDHSGWKINFNTVAEPHSKNLGVKGFIYFVPQLIFYTSVLVSVVGILCTLLWITLRRRKWGAAQ